MMLANRTCRIVASIKATITNNMSARIQDMRGTNFAAEKTGLALGLNEVDKDFADPKRTRVVRNVFWETPE